jgi:hypothetical protein
MPVTTLYPSEAEDKDLLESDSLQAIVNLQKYQTEMKAWRNNKEKQKTFHIGDLVLVWSPHTESLGKLQPKWNGPYVIAEKSRPGRIAF